MKEFRDDKGRSWAIHLSCTAMENIRSAVGFDFADFGNGKAVELFSGNTTHLLGILWALVKGEAEKRGVSYEDFGDGLRGDSIDSAVKTLKEELLDFFPTARRGLMERLLARVEKMVAEQQEKAIAEIDNLRPVSVIGGDSPTSAPESLELTPASGLSGS